MPATLSTLFTVYAGNENQIYKNLYLKSRISFFDFIYAMLVPDGYSGTSIIVKAVASEYTHATCQTAQLSVL